MSLHNSSFILHPYPVKSPKKLIEVALPLDAINIAAAREKSIRHGHPSTLHLWWARRPLAAARAVIFAQLVNDPSWKWELENPGQVAPNHLKASWAASRKRLFTIIEDLVQWENTTNEAVLERARAEIRKSWREVCELNKDHPQAAELFNPEKLPALHDPFAGGGTIPLEAQRLGLEAYASDLNPVAVLINKAMIEIPPKFAGRPPVSVSMKDEGRSMNGAAQQTDFHTSSFILHPSDWPGATGLAEDVRYYGAWMREEAQKRIGHLYPKVQVVQNPDGTYRHATPAEIENPKSKIQNLTVIAWLWARTVKSPNPAFSHVDVPLASTFILSSKEGKQAYVQPVVEGDRYSFTVKLGTPPAEASEGTKAKGRGANFRCIVSDVPISGDYIKAEGQAGRMGVRLMAIVAEGVRGRVYISPTSEMEAIARIAEPTWKPTGEVPARLTGGTCVPYGLKEWGDLFTPRQLVALTTFSDLVAEAREKIRADARAAGMPDDERGLEDGGNGATAYAEAVAVYLALAVDKSADYNSSLVVWSPTRDQAKTTFARQALPMVWDFAEVNVFADAAGDIGVSLEGIRRSIRAPANQVPGFTIQADAQKQTISWSKYISTDPPYYDNIGYADLSDFFYVWLRRALRTCLPNLFSTMAVPKAEELVATPYRHGSKEKAEAFFLDGMTKAMSNLTTQAHPEGPITIYYAFKQSETEDHNGTSSTGWETFLEAVLRSGWHLTGTWPMRTEREARSISIGTNSLASSIILVCRKRPADAPTISRRQFIRELNAVLPEALDEMTRGVEAKDEGKRMRDEGSNFILHTSSFILPRGVEAKDEGKRMQDEGSNFILHPSSFILPVDLSQAIIGPGMAVFSKYAAVLEADGTPMSVRTALQLINRFLAEDDFDHDTQFCLHWFEQYGWKEGRFGEADVLARAKATSVAGLADGGVLRSGGGVVRLLRPDEYPANWSPQADARRSVWETLHHLIRAQRRDGDSGAGRVLAAVKGQAEAARQLAYRLYTLCERRGWAEDARAYNELITSWSGIESAAGAVPVETQNRLFE